MRKFTYPILIILVSIGFYLWEQQLDKKHYEDLKANSRITANFDYLPKGFKGELVSHAYYDLAYSETHEQALWVAYKLQKSHLSDNDFKRPYFEIDPLVKTQAASWRNYKNSGYDRGHLCPAGDRRFSKEAYDETFLTSNISPQLHDFNAGIWNELEQKIRYWVKKDQQLYIVTGPVFKNTSKTIGSEQVTVPTHFYKAILKYGKGEPKCIGFLFPHKKGLKNLKNYSISIDKLEETIGYDLFSSLDDALENKLEKENNQWMWRF